MEAVAERAADEWSGWLNYIALLNEIQLWLIRSGPDDMPNFDIQIRPISSSPSHIPWQRNDLDIWQGPTVLEMEIRGIEDYTNRNRVFLLYRYKK